MSCNSCGNSMGFGNNWWWIIFLVIIFFSWGNNSCGCGNNSCGCGNCGCDNNCGC